MTPQSEALSIDTPTTLSTSLPRGYLFHRNATFLALFIGYGATYLCRQNLGIAFSPMKESLGIDAIQFGWISSTGTLMYSVGKVLTGSLADSERHGGKTVFLLALFGSAFFTMVFSLGTGIGFFLIAWSLNRIFQTMGWGGAVSVIARWFPKDSYGTAMGWMAMSYQVGAIVASLFAGMILSYGLDWQMIFILPALTLAAIGLIVRPFLVNQPKDLGLMIPALPQVSKAQVHGSLSSSLGEQELSYLQRFRTLLSNRAFLIMLSLAFIVTFLRECFSLWMPAFFSEMGESASGAAFKSTLFPLLGCIGTLFAGWFSDRFLSSRRAPVIAIMMFFLVLSLIGLGNMKTLTLLSQSLVGPWFTESLWAGVLVSSVGFFLLGPYSFVAGVVALDFGGKRTAGTAAGLLDGAGYLGGTLSGIGVAKFVVSSGWNQTFLAMAILASLGVLLCLLVWNVKPKT
jgi:sugar phosphate permease